LAVLPQQVAAGDVRHAKTRRQKPGLGTFAGAGRAKQQYDVIVRVQRHCCVPLPAGALYVNSAPSV
jgi:hypothetical protein